MTTELTVPQRFMQKMEAEYSASIGEIKLSEKDKMLLQSQFIGIDNALIAAETRRLNKKNNQEPLSVEWKNVNMAELPRKMIHYAKLGLNPLCSNHMFFIPFKNKALNKYDIQIIEGYRGLELKALKYGFDVPAVVIVELVRKNDVFKVNKRDANNSVESYTLEISDPFDRGDIIGGFWYKKFKDETKNELKIFTIQDIEKRKPKYASADFWGGKDNYGNQKEGWVEEMYSKTISRNAYNSITIDADKIDETFIETQEEKYEVYQDIEPVVEPKLLDISDAVEIIEPGAAESESTNPEVTNDQKDDNVVEGQLGLGDITKDDEAGF